MPLQVEDKAIALNAAPAKPHLSVFAFASWREISLRIRQVLQTPPLRRRPPYFRRTPGLDAPRRSASRGRAQAPASPVPIGGRTVQKSAVLPPGEARLPD